MNARSLMFGAWAVIISCLSQAGMAQETTPKDTFRFYQNAELQYDSTNWKNKSYQVVQNGNYNVFEFVSNNSNDPGNKSSVRSIISWAISMGQESFQISDVNDTDFNGVLVFYGRCQDWGIQPFTGYSVKGNKISDDQWFVEYDIAARGLKTDKTYRYTGSQTYTSVK